MKFSAAVLAVSATVATAGKTISGKNAASVLRNARLVEGSRRLDQDEEENAFLGKYNIKFITCKAGETVINPENGEYEYGAVVVRACPSEEGCDSDSTKGCKEGYGDYVVSVGTFVEAWFEDQRDNMNWDDNFDVDEYTECKDYKVEDDGDDGNQNPYADYEFYLGPTCTEEGDDIKLALFDDQYCTTESSLTFEEISNGWSLPFGSGGLVSTNCQDCMQYDDGNYELREMCERIYEDAASKCETNMEYTSYYGANEGGCEYIEELLPKKAQSGRGGRIIGWIILAVIIASLIGYVMWWRKKKASA